MRLLSIGIVGALGTAIVAAMALSVGSPRARSARSVSSLPPSTSGSVVPVVIELFTSEGCSSCPPADDILEQLLARQPVPGAEIIGLEEHVDYWDRLGWRDRFSSALFSNRQSSYEREVLHRGHVYTPQAIVDGSMDFVGSDYWAATAAVARSARRGKRPLVATVMGRTAPEGSVAIRLEAPEGLTAAGRTEMLLAVTEDGLTANVAAGENGGRTLRHVAVVRMLTSLGAVPVGDAPWRLDVPVPLANSWDTGRLKFVAFAQVAPTNAIIAAAVADMDGGARHDSNAR